ncbi:hypothetical protein TRVA0_047S00892 [Trichomonascus vanleenenianus]|uniref:COG1/VPS51 family protein n=1 Tax=Trichomonascus vanleenenianus TaxID=2268995 RepID=UPI003ECA0329
MTDRQGTPSTETEARKRLREFYKLQESKQEASVAKTPTIADSVPSSSSSSSLDDEAETSSALDEVADADAFVKQVLAESDTRELLKQENTVVEELRTLESEQKALVYNNYNKLITASATLQGMASRQQDNAREDLIGNLSRISDISKRLPRLQSTEDDSGELTTKLNVRHAARWVLTIEKKLGLLIAQNKRDEAILQGQQAIKLFDSWIDSSPEGDKEIKELSIIRDRCQTILREI